MAGHEVYAVGAFSAVAVVLLARWCLTGRRRIRRTAVVFRRASRWTTLRKPRHSAATPARTEQRPATDTQRAQRVVREAEDLLHAYWRQLSPLYLAQHDHHQH